MHHPLLEEQAKRMADVAVRLKKLENAKDFEPIASADLPSFVVRVNYNGNENMTQAACFCEILEDIMKQKLHEALTVLPEYCTAEINTILQDEGLIQKDSPE